MADLYSVDIPQGGSGAVAPEGAGFLGLRQELLRQAGLARQAQLDELERQKLAMQQQLQKENIASQIETRKGQVLLNTEKANAMEGDQFAKSHGVGDTLSPAEQAVALRLYGSNAVNTTPAQPEMTAGIPSQFAQAPATPEAASEVPITAAVPEQKTFAGSEAQQSKKSAQDLAHSILDGDYDTGDPDTNAEYKAWALTTLMSGKATTLPLRAPKKDATQTKAGDDLAVEKIFYDRRIAKGETPDAAKVGARQDFNKLQGEQARQRIDVSVGAASKRQTSTQTFQTKQQFRRELTDNEKAVDKDIERSDRALALLNKPNFVTDAVAGPEFLQIVAGGMGSGLRMTDAELRRINDAQTKIDQFKGQLAKWDVLGIGDRRTIQDAMRGQMKDALEAVHAARNRKAALAEETLKGLEDADTQDEIDALHSKYWSDRRTAATMNQTGAPAPSALPPGVTVTKHAK